MGFEQEFDEIINNTYSDDKFSYQGEEEFTPKEREPVNNDPNPDRKQNPKQRKKKKKPGAPKPKEDNVKTRIGIVLISCLLASGGLFYKYGPLNKRAENEIEPPGSSLDRNEELPSVSGDDGIQEPSKKVEPSVTMEDGEINPGLSDFEHGNNDTSNKNLTDADEFVKDINGNEIPKGYKVTKIEHEVDFVNYIKKRGVTANGVELLWLDAEYKGNPYTVQVPFKIWKELDTTGITVVNMEVLVVDKDKRIISYMEVKDNYKEIMEQGEKALKKGK